MTEAEMDAPSTPADASASAGHICFGFFEFEFDIALAGCGFWVLKLLGERRGGAASRKSVSQSQAHVRDGPK
jgi:hypothetical protein